MTDLEPTVTTTALAFVGRGIGVAIPVLIATLYGATEATDAFLFVYGIVLFVVSIVANAIETMVVPFAVRMRDTEEDHVLSEFVGAVVLLSGAAMTVVGGTVLLVSKAALASATSLTDVDLAYQLLLEVSPLFPLVAISSVFNGVLNARRLFWFPALSPGARSIVVMSGMWAFHDVLGVHALPVSYVGGEAVRAMLAAVLVHQKCGVRARMRLGLTDMQVEFAKSSVILASGSSVGGLIPLVDRAFASTLGPGKVSLLAYARSVFFIPVTLVQSGFLVVSLTRTAELYSQTRRTIGSIMKMRTVAVAVVAVGLSILGWVASENLTRILYGRALLENDLNLVVSTLRWSILALVPYLIASQLAQGLVVSGALGVLVLWTCVGLIVVAVGDRVLIAFVGLPGIALANVLAYSVVSGGLGGAVLMRERAAKRRV